MLFSQKKRPGHGDEKNTKYCRIHNQRVVQLGNCLTCNTIASICQTKGCIKNHEQNQRIHNVFTIEYIQHVVKQFLTSDQSKKAYLKKMVAQYFTAAKMELQVLYQQIYEAVDHFKFDNIIFREDENITVQKLIEQDYNNITCSQIAIVIPKLIKYTNFEDGHFTHLREYLKNQKQKVPGMLDSIILNLPYFRQNMRKKKQNQFVQISSQWLRQVNQKLRMISGRPKKLRIRYIDDEGEEEQKVDFQLIQRQFIRNLCSIDKLTSVQQLQIYCVWNVKDEDFQVAFFQALTRYPFLKTVTVYTGYKVTSTKFIDEIISEGAVDVRVYKKQWTF